MYLASPTHDWAHITSEMIEDVMRVNIDSMLYSYQTVLRYMMKKKIRGSFLNFSSSTALAYRDALAAVGVDLGAELLDLRVNVDHDDLCALLAEELGRLVADAAGSPRDDGHI